MENLSSVKRELDIVTKKYTDEAIAAAVENKVDKVEGKGLSTNDFTNEDKEKLASLSEQGYTLPVASSDAIGGVKSGTDITVDNNGNVSVNDNSHKHTASNISDLDSYISGKISNPGYSDITGKPTLNGVTIEGTKTSDDYSIADAEHSHDVSDITGLTATVDELNYVDGVTSNIQTQLNNKAPSTHNHTASQITDLSKSSIGLGNVENKSSATIRSEITSGNVTTALGFTPVGEEHTHTASDITDLSKSSVGLGNVENKSSATIRGEITSSNVTTALGFTPMNANLKGANSGVAELDANGKVPTSQLPSYVDDVLEYSAKASFPTTGEAGKIYVDLTTNLTYRWSGSAYTEISPSLALGETSSTAYRGDRGKTAYDHSQIKDGSNPHGTTFANIASKPTTISGYGITDAKIASGVITLGSNTITPLTSSSSLDATKLTGTASINTTGNAATATKATQDSGGQQINTTYLKNVSVPGQTVTITKGNGTTSTVKGFTATASNATSNTWTKLGTFDNKTQGNGGEIWLFGGQGQNSETNQNMWAHLFIKKGYQATASTTKYVAATYEIFTPPGQASKYKNVKFKVFCTEIGKVDVWVYFPYNYSRCYYYPAGMYDSFTVANTQQTEEPVEGDTYGILQPISGGIIAASSNGTSIDDTIKSLSISGKTITYTKGNDTTGTLTTQDTTYGNATTSAAGLMSSTDKSKLDGIATGANKYALPAATSSTLGGIKVGSGLSVASDGTVTVAGGSGKTEVAVQTTEPTDADIVLWIDPSDAESLDAVVSNRGAYSSSTAYQPNDMISYNGSWYICNIACTGKAPGTGEYWTPLGVSYEDRISAIEAELDGLAELLASI